MISYTQSTTWSEQNRQGREFADSVIERMQADHNPLHLRDALTDLFSDRDRRAEAVGFAQNIAERLIQN
ncbi:hypothetical protein SAMN05880582_102193 [Rhizobium sp. RU20A]|uniref:hypothetical protein n=1 Tax=Rhizobium sp. RU20A TaxID=1907412 RepID=UPI000956304D|nr:hypothetical protein [Rhizobium sp. RU20A]SIQ57943.1 hypothetical protein SAMN05880582_102193 [Rhizobium sp. RU20A]